MNKNTLSPERARQLLHYDQHTGEFRRKIALTNSVKVGDVAGSINGKGYVLIYVDGKKHLAHRLAWLLSTGQHPEGQIDHINGVKTDNRFSNLRCVNNSLNCQNQRKAKAVNSSGLLGVSWMSRVGKWRAQIQVNSKVLYLGLFQDKEEAHQVYLQAKRLLHHGCTI